MFTEPELGKHGPGIRAQDLLGRAALVERKQNGDQAAHDVGIAVTLKAEDGGFAGSGAAFAGKPNLAGAAAHPIGLGAQGLGQWRQGSAKLDDITVAVLPVIEERKVGPDAVDRHELSVAWNLAAAAFGAAPPAYGLRGPGCKPGQRRLRRRCVALVGARRGPDPRGSGCCAGACFSARVPPCRLRAGWGPPRRPPCAARGRGASRPRRGRRTRPFSRTGTNTLPPPHRPWDCARRRW